MIRSWRRPEGNEAVIRLPLIPCDPAVPTIPVAAATRIVGTAGAVTAERISGFESAGALG
jgi:hypothetical protein